MPDIGKIYLQVEVLKNLSKMYQSPATSDVTFLIGNEKLPAYRLPLAAQSGVFQILLFGKGYRESGQRNIELEVPINAMKMLLTFVYTGKIDLRHHDLHDVADLMELAHRYEMQKLEKLIAQYLCVAVTEETVCDIFDIACLVNCRDLVEQCWTIVEMIVEGIYSAELDLSYKRLVELLDREPRKVSEVKLFQFIGKLMENPAFCTEDEKSLILSKIDFSKMSVKQLYGVVEPTGVLSKTELSDTIKRFSLHEVVPLHKRASEISTVLLGTNAEFLFQVGDNYTTPDEHANCIMIDFNSLYLITSMKFYLRSADGYNGYFIEVSTNNETWTRIIHYSECSCSGQQNLYFSETTARFIKIAPGYGKSKFECNSLEIGYDESREKSLGGFVCPEKNVAVPGKAEAFYLNPPYDYKFDEKLLNGKYANQGAGTPYTAHALMQNGNIIVRFRQPYILSSCRFLLWDFDARKFSYKVEVVPNRIRNRFTTVINKDNEFVVGWQTVTFAPRPVLYFRIKGNRATVGNELRLVHFEAPAGTQVIMNEGQKNDNFTQTTYG